MTQRHWEECGRDFTSSNSFPMFFVEQVITQKSSCLASAPTDRLKTLANWFNTLATASSESLTAMYRDSQLRASSELSMHLSSLLTTDDSDPSAWQDYLKNGIQALSTDMEKASRPDFPVKGRPNNLEGAELISFWQETWSGFANSLNAWPDIREAATKILQPE